MYKAFFGLKDKPFKVVSDPDFYYASSGHEAGLKFLQANRGTMLLTGDAGVGKTMLLNVFLRSYGPGAVVIRDTNVRVSKFYSQLGQGLGLPRKRSIRGNLYDFERVIQQRGHLLIALDDAHALSNDMLKELGNLAKLNAPLTLLLVGQKGLLAKLNNPLFAELKASVAAQYQLGDLKGEELAGYIDHRLAKAGCEQPKPVFARSVLDEISHYAGGTPRLINLICDNAMLAAYTEKSHQVSARMIKDAYVALGRSYDQSRNPMVTLGNIGLPANDGRHARRSLLAASLVLLMVVSNGLWLHAYRADRVEQVQVAAAAPVQDLAPAVHEETEALVEPEPEVVAPVVEAKPELSLKEKKEAVCSVSVGSFYSITDAESALSELSSTGIKGSIYPYKEPGGQRWYRLTVGSFKEKEEAQLYAQQLKEKGYYYARPVTLTM